MEDFRQQSGFDILPTRVLRKMRDNMRKIDDDIGNLLQSIGPHLDRDTIDRLSPKARLFFVDKD